MAVAPKSAFGSLLQRNTNTVAGVRNLTGPGYGAETIDVTHHASSGNYREMVPSFLTGGEVTFDLLYDSADAEHMGLFTDFEARTLQSWNIDFTDTGAEIHSFSGYVSSMELAAPIDDALTMACVITISGQVTRA